MDLKKMNVVELNAQQVKETEGGIIPILIPFAVAYWAGGACIDVSAFRGLLYLGYNNNK